MNYSNNRRTTTINDCIVQKIPVATVGNFTPLYTSLLTFMERESCVYHSLCPTESSLFYLHFH